MDNNEMIEYKENVISKIKRFFLRLLKKEKCKTEIVAIEKNDNIFKDNFVMKQDKEKLKILDLQKDFKNNFINEEDIPKEEKDKLIELYKEQNEQMKAKIAREKIEIQLMIKNLKKV